MAQQRRRLPRADIHAHFVPEDYRRAARAAGRKHPDLMPSLPEWKESHAIAMMDALSIRTAMLSIPPPGVHFGDDLAARMLARSVNEQGADLVRSWPERFGLFAALPLPDIAGAISESIHALDDLGADGVTIETSRDGIELGDPALDPLMQLLNRRRAVVFVHPRSASCAGCGAPQDDQPGPIDEFMVETTRTITSVICRRTLKRFPGVRMIVPNAGSALPVLAARLADQAPSLSLEPPITRDEVYGTLRTLHYDLAWAPRLTSARALIGLADPGRIHYGSAWPFTPRENAMRFADEIEAADVFDDTLRRRILLNNTLDLFPRLNR